jgi:two-component system chemotaxis response regulator CheB
MTFDALNAGALAAMRKPGLEDVDTCEKLVETVRLMAGVSVVRRWSNDQIPTDNHRVPAAPIHRTSNGIRLIGIASSTGGPGVLAQILKPLPENFPIPILIVQHVTNGFSVGLADWLDGQVDLQVRVSGHGDYPKAGVVLMPPDDYHVQLSKSGTVELSKAPPFKGLRPSANYLFHSMAHFYGSSGMGIILTGMGDDGAEGMEAMYRAGAPTIAQDEESCVVYGMPHEAVKRKAVRWVMTPDQISQKLLEFT